MDAWLRLLASWQGVALAGLFVLLAVLERLRGGEGATPRLLVNLGCWLLGGWLVSWLPGGAMGAAGDGARPFLWLQTLAGPGAVLVAGLLALDLFAYAAHRLHHSVHPLWRLHAVHHADPLVDASTGLRHHPGEAVSVAVLGGLVFGALGLPAWTLATGAAVFMAWELAQHADLPWPPGLERAASRLLVTPGLHRVHHSEDPRHHGANFGTVLSVWDRLFGTLLPPQPGVLRYGIGPAGAGAGGPMGTLLLPLRLGRPGTAGQG